MSFRPPPATACWQHRGARSGFEVAYFSARELGWRIDGRWLVDGDPAPHLDGCLDVDLSHD